MADICDMAQEAEEAHLASALGNRHAADEEPDEDVDGNRYCLTCGVTIPPARVAAVNAVRCVDCQSVMEVKARGKA